MKKFLAVCLGVFIGWSSNGFNGFEVRVMAQQSQAPSKREVPTPVPEILVLDNPEKVSTPIPETQIYDYIRGPAEEIFTLEIRDGLKRFLLADLYVKHGGYDKALEIVDYTKVVEIPDRQLVVEKDPEIIRLLEYQRREIERMRARPREIPSRENLKRQADNRYKNALVYQKFEKHEQAIQALLEVLDLYQQIKSIDEQMRIRYQLAIVYKETGQPAEAVQQAREFLKLEQELDLVKKTEKMQELLKEAEGF